MRINVEGVSYNVVVKGNDDAPAVILLHGFTGDYTTWNSLCGALKDSFRVIAIDLLGHGKTDSPSTPERYEMEHAANDIVQLMDLLRIDHAHLLGYSMGGRLALGVAARYPTRIKSLLLESSSPGLKAEGEKEARIRSDESLATRILEEGIDSFIDYWENIPLFQTQRKLPGPVQEKIRDQRLQNNPVGLANSLKGFGTGKQPSLWQYLDKQQIPVLLMCGSLDRKFCNISEEMDCLLPESTIIEFNQSGHTIHVEEPEKFDTIVKEFLIKQTL